MITKKIISTRIIIDYELLEKLKLIRIVSRSAQLFRFTVLVVIRKRFCHHGNFQALLYWQNKISKLMLVITVLATTKKDQPIDIMLMDVVYLLHKVQVFQKKSVHREVINKLLERKKEK